MMVKGYKILHRRNMVWGFFVFLDLLHSMMSIVNNKSMYISKLLSVNFKCSHHKNFEYLRW